MESCVLQQICTQDNEPLRVYITALEDSVELVLFQKENAWKSTVVKKELLYFAEEYKVSLENYCSKLLDYIKNAYPNIVYVFKNEEFTINRLLENSLMVKYFACKVEETNYVNHVEQIMDELYLENTRLCDDLHVLQKEKEEILKNKNDCESKLTLLTNKKVADESELYGQFVLVLNEKKRRIQHLTELLEAFKKGRSIANPEIKVTNRKKKRETKNPLPLQKKEIISESGSSDEDSYHADTDKSDSEPQNTRSNSSSEKEVAEECRPSTSAGAFDFLEDDFDQSHILPKRVKYAKENDNVSVVPGPSDSPPPKAKEPQEVQRSKSPEIDLSTQQLLDML